MDNFDFDLHVHKGDYGMRAEGIFDEDVVLLGKFKNRIAVADLQVTTNYTGADAHRCITDINLLLLAHPHPSCTFNWVALIVNTDAWPDSKILDLLPRSEKGDQPVKYTVGTEGGFSFEISTIKLGPSYTRKSDAEYNVYYDKIIATGLGTSKAMWTFKKQPGQNLNLENRIQLKISHTCTSLHPQLFFSVEAELSMEGWKRAIPVVGSKKFYLR